MTSNPHHLNPNWFASAFMPFCSYASSLERLGAIYPDLTSIPVCNSFKPTLLNGEICYTLKLDLKAIKGITGGLIMLLDYNTEKSILTEALARKSEDSVVLGYISSEDKSSAQIYIPTLSPYTGYGSGSYIMTSLKYMKGTKDFLGLSFEDKLCETYDYDACRMNRLLEKGKGEIGCVPFGWTHVLPDQVLAYK